ncbi:hypothetical protein GCM10027429_22710 [Marivirga atlantica]|jgi:hypothetical protein|uniref:Uncharacterized protein n=1 Tax=Marivirga atlantica TaxID=1548457 RepID=A0A937DJD7_9BACT|nr:hypothetical protein [Marivirga atlantica]MBL0765890.1 hypothetical protein [Marivirga atlantica]
MKDNYTEHCITWYKFLLRHISKRIGEREDYLKELAERVASINQEYKDEAGPSEDESCQRIRKVLSNNFSSKPKAADLQILSADFFGEKDFFLRKLPEIEVKEQLALRFRIDEADSGWLKFRKSFKIVAFHLSKIPFYIANLFRKDKKPLKYWSHAIPVKQLTEAHLIRPFYKVWQQIEDKTNRLFIEKLAELKVHQQLEPKKLEEDFATLKAEATDIIQDWYENASNEFHKAYELVDTIEHDDKKLRMAYLEKKEEEAIEDWEEQFGKWENTIHANFEDWRSKLELSALKAHLNYHKEELEKNIEDWQNKVEKNYQQEISSFLQRSLKNFTEDGHDSEALKKLIAQLTYQSKKDLNMGLLSGFETSLSENSLLNQLDKFEHKIEERINSLEAEYVVVKSGVYDEPLPDSELSNISNHELLSFELVPLINEKIEDLKGTIFSKMDKLLVAAGDIDEIVNYVLNTASNALNEELDAADIQHILKEGFERAINANQEIKDQLDHLIDNTLKELDSIENSLTVEINELNNKENIAALKLRISKAKALQKSEAFNKQIRSTVSDYWDKVKAYGTVQYNWAINQVEQINRKFFSINVTDQPNREVSDFLNIAKKTIDGLPLIYKRLYAIEPLDDTVLFEGREKELERFNSAYTAWQEGHYGDVILTGEKWSGMTSLINYVLKTVKLKHAFVRLSFTGNQIDRNVLIDKFAQTLKQPDIDSADKLIAYLNGGTKRIIIVEDLQNLYLRVIGGQKALIELIDIIAATQKNIFWMVSVSLYAYRYLERTLKINAFFSYPIVLEQMDADTISKLVIKRNRVSGFKINFEAPAELADDKKFKKLNDEEKQEFLRSKFFKELHSFSKSNVSMALMYWLLSTKSVDGHSITIKSFEKPDFSFLNSLQADRVFLLHALILHDGLNVMQAARVLNMNEQKVRFMIIEMLEDGVLIEEEDFFLVNPIIFRNTVQLLKVKNLIS